MDGPVTLDALNAALDSLLMQEAPPYLAEDDITIMRLSRRAGCGSAKAKSMITKWVTDGKLEYIGKRREERGHLVEAWRLSDRSPASSAGGE
jgi:hypothetical protein